MVEKVKKTITTPIQQMAINRARPARVAGLYDNVGVARR